MKKKQQRLIATIIAVLISIAMIGSAVLGYFGGAGISSSSNGATQTNSALADYQAQKERLEAMNQQAKTNPDNVQLQIALGNEYYDAGIAAQTVAPAEVQANFKHAVAAYQNALKSNKDPDVMVDMATAAFYSGDNDLAEKTYKEAIVLKPGSYNALGNYGVFLSQAKKDWAGALALWQKAQPLAQSNEDKEKIKMLISEAESQLKSNSAATGLSNPNPAVKNEEGNSATP